MTDVKKDDQRVVVDEETGVVAVSNPDLSEAQVKEYLARNDVWAIYGYGLEGPPVGGIVRDEVDQSLPLAERLVPEEVRAKVKRHLVDPLLLGVSPQPIAGFDRLLVLEYPVIEGDKMYGPATKPVYFGDLRIDGAWALVWHDSTTSTDKFVHCPGCVQNMVMGLLIHQKELQDAKAHRKTLN